MPKTLTTLKILGWSMFGVGFSIFVVIVVTTIASHPIGDNPSTVYICIGFTISGLVCLGVHDLKTPRYLICEPYFNEKRKASFYIGPFSSDLSRENWITRVNVLREEFAKRDFLHWMGALEFRCKNVSSKQGYEHLVCFPPNEEAFIERISEKDYYKPED